MLMWVSVMQLQKTADLRCKKLEKELSQLCIDAEGAGIVIVPQLPYVVSPAQPDYTDRMRYVKLLAEEKFLASCTSGRGIYVAALRTEGTRNLAARAQGTEARERLQRDIAHMEKKLKIEERWTPDSVGYKVWMVTTFGLSAFAFLCMLRVAWTFHSGLPRNELAACCADCSSASS